ncbi:ketosteroid isomerase-related protein [Frankia sp. AvcI1]|uniref:ketosteroid isomerase-related protein n=1 Tax=Frankia sp. AvcI1 TaxID=573496 RepID=UPI0006EC24E2|nr:ketosteroid isomerase-related protein [Frankia sp. AvcI1]
MSQATEHAERWARAITADTDAAVALYADAVLYDDRRAVDHVVDTATDRTQVRERLAPFANQDPANGLGIHRFDVLEAIETTGGAGARAVTILWRWTGEHLAGFRGVPTGGRSLATRGQTWHQLDADGRIDRELTNWNDTPVLQQLGLPVLTPHYWVADAGAIAVSGAAPGVGTPTASATADGAGG